MILAVALFALAPQKLQDTYGRTNAQILAMGHEAWAAFYEKRAGDSGMTTSNAEGLYTAALRDRNDRLLARRADRKTLVALRRAMDAFADDAVAVGELGTGGGTVWIPVSLAYKGDAEKAIYRMMTPSKPVPHRVTSDVTKELALVRRALANPDVRPDDRHRIDSAMVRLEGDWRAVSALASARDRRDSDLALEFCRATLKDVRQTVKPG